MFVHKTLTDTSCSLHVVSELFSDMSYIHRVVFPENKFVYTRNYATLLSDNVIFKIILLCEPVNCVIVIITTDPGLHASSCRTAASRIGVQDSAVSLVGYNLTSGILFVRCVSMFFLSVSL